jgi:predicted nucleotidyltransferase
VGPWELLESRREEVEALCRRFHVVRLRVFGSAAAGLWKPESSDLDLLAEYGPESALLPPLDRLVGLQLELEALLGRKVDVVDWGAARNPYFRRQAESQAQEFYAA